MTSTTRLSPPRILLHPANRIGASSIYRIAAPADALRRAGFATTLVDQRMPSPETISILKPDAIVLQHFFTDDQTEAARGYKKAGVKMVYEIDDLFWAVDDANPNKVVIPVDVKARIQKVLRMCDHAVASTGEMAERLHKDMDYPLSRIRVARNALPQAFVTAALAARGDLSMREPNAIPRVGWAGSISHQVDLALIEEVVQRTATKVQWVFMGSVPDSIRDMVEFHKGVPFAQYPTKLASLGLDLAIAPMADTPFNHCKSDLRILEYAACGYPVIASAVGAFLDSPTAVLLTKNTPNDWIDAIAEMLSDTNARAERAQSLHDSIKENRILESRSSLVSWTSAWTGIKEEDLFVPGPVPAAYARIGLAIVGEPLNHNPKTIQWPRYKTIREAREALPGASILYVRPGAVPSQQQIDLLLADADQFPSASLSAFTNDGDYPAPGKFMNLSGTTRRDMADAALMGQMPPVPSPYPLGPVTFLDNRALSLVGLPDESRYVDTETALMDWGARVVEAGGIHATDPCVFVPVLATRRVDQKVLQPQLMEIATWHPGFQTAQEQAARDDTLKDARRDLDMAYARLAYAAPSAATYEEWRSMHDIWTEPAKAWAAAELARGEPWPKVSIVMPTYNTNPEHLKAAIDSVVAQAYGDWELIIVDDASTHWDEMNTVLTEFAFDPRIVCGRRQENGHICHATNEGLAQCTGEWVVFLDHDDVLVPNALLSLMLEARSSPTARFIYADSDLISPEGAFHSPDFKPGFDYDLLLAQNYVCHPACYKLADVMAVGCLRPGFEGSQDYDLILRVVEMLRAENISMREAIRHVPLVLYHWRQAPDSVSLDIDNKRYALDAAETAVVGHLSRMKTPAFVGRHPGVPLHHLVRFLPPSPAPKATIIILTQFNARVLDHCLKSILSTTAYPNFSVVIRQVGDDKEVTSVCTAVAKADKRVRHIRGGGEKDFNFALLCNACVKAHAADADVVVLMNDDVHVLEAAWLHDMVGTALRPDVGAVGVKLIYPDGRVQHDGILLSPDAAPGEIALHAFQGMHHAEPGPFGRAALTRQCAAVTAACIAIRRSVYENVGGMDAIAFPLDYNDVDLCLRLAEEGLSNVVLSHIVMIHHEGASKRYRPDTVTRSGMLTAEMKLLATGRVRDPYTNPNLLHAPAMSTFEPCPLRPWRVPTVARTLIVCGTREHTFDAFAAGDLPIAAVLDGTRLHVTEPTCLHASTIDLRSADEVASFLEGYGIGRVVLCSLGNGASDALGAFTAMARNGVAVVYAASSYESVCPRVNCTNDEGPCGFRWRDKVVEGEQPFEACQACLDRCGSPYGPVSIIAWRNAWNRLAAALEPGGVATD